LRSQQKLRFPIDIRVHISIAIGGRQRGDIDNIAGSVLDALVQSDILADDQLAVVGKLTIEHFPDLPLGANIQISPPPTFFYAGSQVCRSSNNSRSGRVVDTIYYERTGMTAIVDWGDGKVERVSMSELEIAPPF
jgi:hypothetical protein